MSEAPPPRANWKRPKLPPDLVDMLHLIAKKQGYGQGQLHLFLYRLVKNAYPDDVNALTKFWGLEWLDEPPPPDAPTDT